MDVIHEPYLFCSTNFNNTARPRLTQGGGVYVPISSSAKRNSIKRGKGERCIRTAIETSESWNPYFRQINKRALKIIHSIHPCYIAHPFRLVHGRFICTHIQQVSIQCAI